jgi:hypothetical protein
MGIRGSLIASGLAGAVAIALAACGPSTSTGAAPVQHRSTSQLVTQMKAAVRDAASMHMSGQVTAPGHPTGLDLDLLRGGDLAGTITQNGVPLHLIGADGKVYVKATPAFLRQVHAASAACSLICGKYVQLTSAEGSSLSGSLSMANLTSSLTNGLPRHLTQVGTTTVNGQQAVVLHGSDGSTLDVAAHGRPYPLRVIAPPGHHETVQFTRWNAIATPSAPPASQVINLNKLKAGNS